MVDVVVAYECEFSKKIYMLMISNALYFEEIEVNLIAPFIIRLAGLEVNEEPKFMAKIPTIEHHSISVPGSQIRFPLAITGIISYLPTRIPTELEIISRDLNPELWIEITPMLTEWDPHNQSYKKMP